MSLKKNLINYRGPYGENKLISPDFIQHEILATRSKMYDWEIKEHVHADLYQLFLIQDGTGELYSNQQKIPIQGPCLITMPSNTLHGFVFHPEINGEVLTFSDSFLENIFKNTPSVFLTINTFLALPFASDSTDWAVIKQTKEALVHEIYEERPDKSLALQALFQWLFIQIGRLAQQDSSTQMTTDNRTLKYFTDFQKNIKRSYQESKSIDTYARELSITSVHLNRICQAVVGQSALHVVHQYVIQQAKTYLLSTSYSISEIAYFLNLKDPAYFTRFFKKYTGVTPSEFRKNE